MASVARLQLFQLQPHPNKLLKSRFLSPPIKFKPSNLYSSRRFSAFRCLSANANQIHQNYSHNESIVADLLNFLNESWTQFHATGRLLEAERPHLYWTPCAAHCIDLMLEDIGKIPKVKIALKKCMFMNGYIYSHTALVNMMRKFTCQRNLHRPAITRFATSFITLSQFHKQKNNLRKMVTSQEWNASKWPKEAGGKKVAAFLLQDNFWKSVVYALKLTGPLVKVLRMVDGEKKPPMGYIYEAMDRAKEAISKSFNMKEEHYNKAFEYIDRRWDCQLHRPLHAAGYFLNPEIHYDNSDQVCCEEVEKGLYDCIARLVPDVETQDNILMELDAFKNATGLFGHHMAIRQRKTKSPAEAKRQLLAAGFHLLNENEEWQLKPGGRYFFTRNMSSLVAFSIGEKYSTGNGFHVIAAHTDSPCLKLKPISASSKHGYLMLNVQTYGGGLWHTWFDRDLSVAGRVIVRSDDGCFIQRLVKIKRPLLRIPTLAIHLDRTVNQDGFKPNLETHLVPLLSTRCEEELPESKEKGPTGSSKVWHHPQLLEVLSEELDCGVDDIVTLELNICDTQPSCLGGMNNEFIFSGRLDNLASSYCALRSLLDSCSSPGDLSTEEAIRMVALFDNEEVGSDSIQGAGAPTMFQAIRRIVSCLSQDNIGEGAIERAIRQSFLVSADMAHGVHPNFLEKHEENHRPQMQKGLVIKHNANQRYATSGVTAFLFKEVAKIHNLPTQEFVVRNDMGCGSTIGPILAAGVGIRTVDCGIPQLSMHSVREICGKEDVDIAYKHFKAFYETFSSIDRKLSVE